MSPNTKGAFLRQELRKKSNVLETSLQKAFPDDLPIERRPKPNGVQRRRRPSVNEAVGVGAAKLSKFGVGSHMLAGALASAVQSTAVAPSVAAAKSGDDGVAAPVKQVQRRRRPSVNEADY
jgi:hypothetical protein